jgi:hypothetical protein
MRKEYQEGVFIAGLFALIGILMGNDQQIAHDASVVNVEVPVRVYDGNRFVDNLNINDFEVYENDILQKLEAVYMIRKTEVVKYFSAAPIILNAISKGPEYGRKNDSFLKKRVFLLYFEMDEYIIETNKAIDYLFENVLIETDVILIVTPIEQWKITMSADNMKRGGELAGELKSRLKKSLRKSGSYIRAMVRDLHDLAVFEDEGNINPRIKEIRANEIFDRLFNYKILNEERFRSFAGFFKPIEGQKHVFIFYQEETYSIPSIFEYFYKQKALERHNKIDKKMIREIYSDAETTIHFMFLRKQKSAKGDVEYREEGAATDVEMTGDIFQAFRDIAIITGGLTESTFNPVYAMKRVLDAAENYYLLYYKPTSLESDKSFKKITVKVKSGNFKVIYRSGYIEK